jgi:hypothetical protein
MRPALPHEVLWARRREESTISPLFEHVQSLAEAVLGGRTANALRPELRLAAAATVGAAALYALPGGSELTSVGSRQYAATVLGLAGELSAPRTVGHEAAGIVLARVTGGSVAKRQAVLAPRSLALAVWIAPALLEYLAERWGTPLYESPLVEVARDATALADSPHVLGRIRGVVLQVISSAIRGGTLLGSRLKEVVFGCCQWLVRWLRRLAARISLASSEYRHARRMYGDEPALLWLSAEDNELRHIIEAVASTAPPSASGGTSPSTPAGVFAWIIVDLFVAELRLVLPPTAGGFSSEISARIIQAYLGVAKALQAAWVATWFLGSTPYPDLLSALLWVLPVQVRRAQTSRVSPLRLAGLAHFARYAILACSAAVTLARSSVDESEPAVPSLAVGRTTGSTSVPVCTESREVAGTVCPLCFGPMNHPTCAPCGHVACWECSWRWCRDKGQCAVCRSPCPPQSLIPLSNYPE